MIGARPRLDVREVGGVSDADVREVGGALGVRGDRQRRGQAHRLESFERPQLCGVVDGRGGCAVAIRSDARESGLGAAAVPFVGVVEAVVGLAARPIARRQRRATRLADAWGRRRRGLCRLGHVEIIVVRRFTTGR